MTADSTQRHYQGEAGRRYQENKRGIPGAAIPWVAALRAEKLARSIRPEDVALEYGVGQGWNLIDLNCRRKLGFDVADYLSEAARRERVEFVSDTHALADGSMDVIICHHTLEHVIDPPAALREMRRLLAPAGRLLLFVPLEREVKYNEFQSGEPNHHLYSWNAQTLGNLAEETGFQVAQAGVGEFGYDRFAAQWAVKFQWGANGFRLLRRALHVIKPIREVRIIATKA